jgi:hypothetical protein
VFLLVWPLVGVGFSFGIALYSVQRFDLTTNILGAGCIVIGIVPYLWSQWVALRRAPTVPLIQQEER